ncbi:MAG: ZIP family metal transporter [Desulfatibacillaceae bacterium]
MSNLWTIVVISILGPVVGSFLGIMRKPTPGFICNMLCFAAGVMLTISFIELIPEGIELSSIPIAVGGLVVGALAMYGVDRLIPHIHPSLCAQEQGCNLQRTSVFLILGIFMHNFPEGLAIAAGGVAEAEVSVVIAVAIAIHNIPEGICTSAPNYLATGKKWQAFLFSASTALPLLAGFLLGYYIFPTIPFAIMGFIVSGTAGLMIYITVDELIPNSCAGDDHATVFSLLAGIVFVIALGVLE